MWFFNPQRQCPLQKCYNQVRSAHILLIWLGTRRNMHQQALTGHVHVVEQAKQRIKSASVGLGGDATNYMPLTKRQLETLTLTLQTTKIHDLFQAVLPLTGSISIKKPLITHYKSGIPVNISWVAQVLNLSSCAPNWPRCRSALSIFSVTLSTALGHVSLQVSLTVSFNGLHVKNTKYTFTTYTYTHIHIYIYTYI